MRPTAIARRDLPLRWKEVHKRRTGEQIIKVRRERPTGRGETRVGSLGVVALAMLAVSMMTPVTAVAQTAEVTFTKDVASIPQRSCQTCHRDGSIAPMSLLTYEEARPWARAIKEKVETRSMPPWYIDKNIGVQGFKYDRSLPPGHSFFP